MNTKPTEKIITEHLLEQRTMGEPRHNVCRVDWKTFGAIAERLAAKVLSHDENDPDAPLFVQLYTPGGPIRVYGSADVQPGELKFERTYERRLGAPPPTVAIRTEPAANDAAPRDAASYAQNPSVLARARDFYATYCASSDGKNYQGLPCPAWDELTPAVRGHWYTVALRSLQLEAAITDGAVRSDVGNERACLPNDYVLGHLADEQRALEVWSRYSGVA